MDDHRLTIGECRTLIPDGAPLTDDEIGRMRDMLYDLADVICDAFSDLENINPEIAGTDAFNPPGALSEQWLEMEAEEAE